MGCLDPRSEAGIAHLVADVISLQFLMQTAEPKHLQFVVTMQIWLDVNVFSVGILAPSFAC